MQKPSAFWVYPLDGPLNILTCPTHERVESAIAASLPNCNFFAYRDADVKNWRTEYAPLPDNYFLLRSESIPKHLHFDLVLSQNKFGQFQKLYPMAREMQVPMISIEHTACMPPWEEDHKEALRNMRGELNIFITHWSLDSWGWENRNDTLVIGHMIDTDLFRPDPTKERRAHVLTVANDYINRDYVLGYGVYCAVTKGLPTCPVGDTAGLSAPARDINHLINYYQTSRVFLNTAPLSPVPHSLLEAMSCGCAVVSINACGVPEYITHGENGLLADTELEMRNYLQMLLEDEAYATKLGNAARETAIEKCDQTRFASQWKDAIKKVTRR